MKPRLVLGRTATAGLWCLVVLVAAAACGPAKGAADKGEGRDGVRDSPVAPAAGGSGARGAALDEAQLTASALVSGDVKDFSAEPLEGPAPTGTSKTRTTECMPIVAVLNGAPEPAPSVSVFRRLVDTTGEGRADQTVVTEVLSSHPNGAADVLAGLRAALASCGSGFTTVGGDLEPSVFTEVKKLPDPKAGDEALSYELTGVAQGDKVPLVFQVVRSGTTVVTFYSVNLSGATAPVIPAQLATVQAEKLER